MIDEHAGGARLDWRGVGTAAELQRLQLQLRRQELVLEVTRLLTSEIELDRLWPLVAQKLSLL